jgi:regulator of protease activity HflC (stomatin/prohibitin superfamily)
MPGPGMLDIRSGSAAVLERAGKITRIVGPGFYLTETFEYLSAMVDLSLQSGSWRLEDVLTKDRVPLEVKLTVQYRIMIDQPALITKAEYRLDVDAIRRAILTTADWHEQTKVVAESILRDSIATRFLDEIYNPSALRFSRGSGWTPRVPLRHELRRRLGRESQRWGVEIVRVTLDKITLPRELEAERTFIEALAEADTQTIKGRARAMAEAERFREILLSLQQDVPVDEETMSDVIVQLAGVLTSVSDFRAFARFLMQGGRAAPFGGKEPWIIGGEEPPADQEGPR